MPQGVSWSEAEYAAYLARAGKPAVAVEEPEAAFQARVLQLAKAHGWLCYHTHDSRHNDYRTDAGFPDLVCVREAVLFAELKTRTGKTTERQERWIQMLGKTGQVEVYVWRPADWSAIHHRLTRAWKTAV